MDQDLKNKTAIVTGSTQGIGYELSKLYIERGLKNLIIVGRDEEKGKKVEDEFNSKNCKCIFVKADLKNVSECRSIVKTADEKYAKVRIISYYKGR